jgi:hypothetical protein
MGVIASISSKLFSKMHRTFFMIVGYRKYPFVSRSFPALALAVFAYAANAVGISFFSFQRAALQGMFPALEK